MQHLLEPSWWEMHWRNLELWWFNQVLLPSNLLQLGLIVGLFLIARLLSPVVRRLFSRLQQWTTRVPAFTRAWAAFESVTIALLWLLMLWFSIAVAKHNDWASPLLHTVTSLLSAWVAIRLISHWVSNHLWSHILAVFAWTLAALSILHLLPTTEKLLNNMALTLGSVRLSLLTLIKGGVIFGLLLWLATGVSGLVTRELRRTAITPAARVLTGKFITILLMAAAVLISLNSMGIDLTTLAVLSGALAVGLGFGLQKIFSNLVSGFILLLDKSIKPGDVISVGQTYGWIGQLGARYVSVVTRDGIEHLIPNEVLITQPVQNWSHSNNLVRLHIPVGISYRADPRRAMELCEEAAQMVPRVLLDPGPRCLLRAFGDSSVDLELRVWINDPEHGRGVVISDVLLGIWDRFQEYGIEIPFQQQDLHIRSVLGESDPAALNLARIVREKE